MVQFAGRVTGERQSQVLGRDASAIVDDADELDAPLFDLDIDTSAARVERIFEQFLDHAGRPFDDLARRDLVDDQRR